MDGNDGEGRMMRTSPVGKIKPLKSLVRTFQRLQLILEGYLHLIYPSLFIICSSESAFEFIEVTERNPTKVRRKVNIGPKEKINFLTLVRCIS